MDHVRQLLDLIEPTFDLSSPLNFLISVYKSTDVPLHTRLRAAAEACKYSAPQLKAVAHVNEKNSVAAMVDRARERAARYTNVIKLEIEPAKALPHDASELRPASSSAVNNSGFRRRF
jgi:hypothetical protein